MSAFDNFNNNTISILSKSLKLQSGRMRSYGPCPACGASKRSQNDKRLPLGVTENYRGWHCHQCKISGNMIDLLCFSKIGKKYNNAEKEDQSLIINWLIDNGYEDETFNETKIQKISKLVNLPSKPVPVDRTSDFRWEEDIWKQHTSLLWSEDGSEVFDYLVKRRKLSEKVIKNAELGCMESNGNKWLVIPLKNETGEVVNLRFRSVPPNKKTFRVCSGRPMPLYGSHRLTHNRKEFIIIVEGELDVLAMEAYGYNNNVVSGTTGASANWKDEWLNILEPYQGFFLWYDNDEAGNNGANKLSHRLGKFRCFRVRSDENDVSDCLIDGKDKEYIGEVIATNITPYISSSLKKCNDYSQEIEQLVLNPQSLRGLPTGSSKLDPLVGGIRAGLWVVSGDTGHGKTTFLTWLLWEQALRHVPVMVTSFEQRPIGTVQKLLRCQLGGDFTKNTAEERKQGIESLGKMPIHILDHYGELETEKVIDAIRFAVRRYDIKIALIDHLGFLIKTTATRDERQSIEHVVRELSTIAIQDDITIMLVCHPNNMATAQQRRVKISDLKGASAIRQDAHVGIIVERNDVSQDSIFPTTTVWFDKVRSEFGQSGSHCTLVFDPLSCIYADDWASTPSGKAGKTVICNIPKSKKSNNRRRGTN